MKLPEFKAGEPSGLKTVADVFVALERLPAERQAVFAKVQKIAKRRRDFFNARGPMDWMSDGGEVAKFKAEDAVCNARLTELAAAEETLQAELAALRDAPLQAKINAALKGKLEEHRLDVAKLDSRMMALAERRGQNVKEGARIYAASQGRVPFVNLDQAAARRMAQDLVEGNEPGVPDFSAPPEFSRERFLQCEAEAIDLALKKLSERRALASAAMAMAWNKEVDKVWREHAREAIFLRIRMATCNRRSARFIGQCPDQNFVYLPAAGLIDGPEDVQLDELIEAAVRENLVSQEEVWGAQNG